MTNGYTAEIIRTLGPARARCERQLAEGGVTLPLQSRIAWAEMHPGTPSWFVAVRDAAGLCRGGIALEVARSRALPGHLLLRGRRVGSALDATTCAAAVAALVHHARSDARILSVTVELFSRDAAAREMLGRLLAAAGFARAAEPRHYTHTILADLAGSDEEHLAALGYSVRRKIREVAKHPLAVRPITSVEDEPRMRALVRQTAARTGCGYADGSLGPVIALSAAHPGLSRLAGLYRTDRNGPDSLLAFAWGCNHGDHVAYDIGASTREIDFGRVSLGYPIIWDLMSWARRHGASWFDLGGVTAGSFGSGDPLGGISDFKRAFAKEVVQVGEEWTLVPHRGRALLARGVSNGAAFVSHLRARIAEGTRRCAPSPAGAPRQACRGSRPRRHRAGGCAGAPR